MSQINFSPNELIKKGMSGTPTEQKVGKFVMGTILATIAIGILYGLGQTGVFTSLNENVFQPIAAIANAALRIGVYSLIGVLAFMFVKAQWRNIGYINDYLARQVFKGIITYDPFLIQEKQILSAEHDVEHMMDEKSKIDGKYAELSKKLRNYQLEMKTAAESLNIVQGKLRVETDPNKIKVLQLDAGDCVRKQAACKNYIDSISPIANDMKFMIDFISEGYQVLKRRIAGAKQELLINKDIFESAHAGAEALERMKKAMVGDIQLNNDAERAQLAVMHNIALTVGQMKVSMEIISDVTRQANLEEGGRLAVARKQLEELNLVQVGSGQQATYALPQNTANFEGTLQLKDLQYHDMKLPD
jgi:hypothetical protein